MSIRSASGSILSGPLLEAVDMAERRLGRAPVQHIGMPVEQDGRPGEVRDATLLSAPHWLGPELLKQLPRALNERFGDGFEFTVTYVPRGDERRDPVIHVRQRERSQLELGSG